MKIFRSNINHLGIYLIIITLDIKHIKIRDVVIKTASLLTLNF